MSSIFFGGGKWYEDLKLIVFLPLRLIVEIYQDFKEERRNKKKKD